MIQKNFHLSVSSVPSVVQILFALLLAAVLPAQDLTPDETAALLARIAVRHKGAALQADFRDEKHLTLMKKPVIETGTLAFLPPDKFRREVKDKSLTICDGTTLWLYYPEYNEVEKYLLSSNRALRESLSAITSGIGLQALTKNYTVQARKLPDGYHLALTPRSASLRKAVAQLTVDITPALAVRRLEIAGTGGDRTVTTLTNETTASLTAKDFQFQPPQGAAISEPLK